MHSSILMNHFYSHTSQKSNAGDISKAIIICLLAVQTNNGHSPSLTNPHFCLMAQKEPSFPLSAHTACAPSLQHKPVQTAQNNPAG